MNSQKITAIALFAALTIALSLWSPIKIPAPYAPFLIYQIWEIPIVAALLLYGIFVALAISVLNTLLLLAIYPGALPTGPLYNFVAVLSMLLGIYLVQKLLANRFSTQNSTLVIASSTSLGILLRVGVMTIMNWTFLRYPPPVGYAMPEGAIIVMLPLIAFFNATLALYTIPVGHFLAMSVKSIMKTMGTEPKKSKGLKNSVSKGL